LFCYTIHICPSKNRNKKHKWNLIIAVDARQLRMFPSNKTLRIQDRALQRQFGNAVTGLVPTFSRRDARDFIFSNPAYKIQIAYPIDFWGF